MIIYNCWNFNVYLKISLFNNFPKIKSSNFPIPKFKINNCPLTYTEDPRPPKKRRQ